ncbi:hypothetical protein FRC18_002963 [Serendipita sp. 400]|nr:hypothetical protein FRC18_002963 [Serendipita sp. 400]
MPRCHVGIDYPELSPYYLRDDYVREDLRENQTGTTLYLDIGVIDITTCTPAQDIFVEIWACSAQGVYSAFGTGPTMGGNPTALPTGSSGTIVPPSQTMSGPFPSGSGFPPGGFPGGGTSKADGDNFLRGGLPADTNGMVELMGQVFFDEALNDEVLAQAAYQGTGQSRTYNAQDGILEQANSGGYSAFAEVERLGDSLDEGLL